MAATDFIELVIDSVDRGENRKNYCFSAGRLYAVVVTSRQVPPLSTQPAHERITVDNSIS
ncbi:hypothetical protein J6590_049921 [Homalodisca vitripennis]|nr:hypothetical protein J6590_049921 [Homalodisca vitripennis]